MIAKNFINPLDFYVVSNDNFNTTKLTADARKPSKYFAVFLCPDQFVEKGIYAH